MADLLQGLGGAGVGFATGGPVGALIGGFGGLFAHGQREDPIARQQRAFQQGIADKLYNFASGVPGSDPQELAALASARGSLGADQRQYQQGIFGQFNPQMRTSLSDMASNLASRFSGQQMALQEAQLQAGLQARRDALLQAAQIAPKAGAQYQPNPFPQMLGQLSQTLAYQMARNKDKNGQPQQPGGGQGYTVPDQSQPGYTPQYPGNTPQPGGGGPAPGGGPFLPGGPLQAMQDAFGGGGSGAVPGAPYGGSGAVPGLAMPPMTLPGFPQSAAAGGPSPADQAYASFTGGNMNNPANGPGGTNTTNNQIRQASGLSYPTPLWQKLANPYGLNF